MKAENIQILVTQFLSAVVHRWKMILIPVLTATVVGPPLHTLVPKTYRSDAKVLVQDNTSVNPFLQEISVDWSVKRRLPVIQTVLSSHRTLHQVLLKLGELDETTPPDEAEQIVRSFSRRLHIFSVGGGIVRISLKGNDPFAVKNGLDVLVQTFVDEMLRPQKQSVDHSATFLSKQLERVSDELHTEETSLSDFKRENQANLPEIYKINLTTLLELRQDLAQAKLEVESERRKSAHANESLRKHNPVVQRLEAKLLKAQVTLQEQLSRYTELHPSVTETRTQIKNLRQSIARSKQTRSETSLSQLEASTLTTLSQRPSHREGIGSEPLLTSEILEYKKSLSTIRSAEARVGALQTELDLMNTRVRAHAQNEQELNRRMRRLNVKSDVYSKLLSKYEDAIVTRELAILDESSQVWIVDPPTLPTRASGPPIALFTIFSALTGFVLGLCFVIVSEALSYRISWSSEIVTRYDLPQLGVLPKMDHPKG